MDKAEWSRRSRRRVRDGRTRAGPTADRGAGCAGRGAARVREAVDLYRADVGRHDRPQGQLHDVAGHQVGHGDGAGDAVAPHHDGVSYPGVQRLRGELRPILVDESEPDRRHQDHGDDHGIGAVPDEERHRRGDHQEQQERAPQLAPEHSHGRTRCTSSRWSAKPSVTPCKVQVRAVTPRHLVTPLRAGVESRSSCRRCSRTRVASGSMPVG